MVKKAVTPGPAKAFWQYMEHEQVEEVFPGDRFCPILPCLGMEIPVGDFAVCTLEDILFADNTSVKIPAKIDDSFVSAADILAVNNPG